MLTKPKYRKAVEEILADPDHPAFVALSKTLSDRAYGRPNGDDAKTGDTHNWVLLMPAPDRAALPPDLVGKVEVPR